MSRRRSNTVGAKQRQEEQLTVRQQLQSISQPLIIKIGIHRTNKSIKHMQIFATISGTRLFQAIEREFYVDVSRMVLFLRGKKIVCSSLQNQQKMYSLAASDIIHIHNTGQLQRSQITIYFQLLNLQLIKIRQLKITTHPQTKINKIVQQNLASELFEDISLYRYIQSGRFIDINNTFFQECIESQSLILVVYNQDSLQSFGKLEERQLQLIESYRRLVKRSSLNFQVGVENEGEDRNRTNFKKKNKYEVKRTLFIPESKEYVWEDDSNSSFSRKCIIKKIKKKTDKKNQNNGGKLQKLQSFHNISNRPLVASSNRGEQSFVKINLQKRQENFKKLTFSEILIPKSSNFEPQSQKAQKQNLIADLKIPSLQPNTDEDLFEQAIEMEFGQQPPQMQNDYQQSDSCNQLNSSAPLIKGNFLGFSYGKNRQNSYFPILNGNHMIEDSSSEEDEDENKDMDLGKKTITREQDSDDDD